VVVVKYLHKFLDRFNQVVRGDLESKNMLKSPVKAHIETRRGSHKLNHESGSLPLLSTLLLEKKTVFLRAQCLVMKLMRQKWLHNRMSME
jgi:hypothetical protein